MDCDFSHSIEDLMKGIEIFKSNEFDVLLGSRYPDGEIVNWSLTRRFFSFLANTLVRFLIILLTSHLHQNLIVNLSICHNL